MKYSPTQYAQSLYESTRGKTEKEIRETVSRFWKIVSKRHDVVLGKKILSAFQEIYNKQENITEADVVTHTVVSPETEKNIQRMLEKKYPTTTIQIAYRVNPEIKGGIIIQIADRLEDGSLAQKLKKLKTVISSKN